MLDEIDSRGLEVFIALLLIIGEANIISATLNKQQGFFTLNIGSNLFEWRKPLVVSTATTSSQTPINPAQATVTPTKTDSISSERLDNNTEVDKDDLELQIIRFGIFLFIIFLLEDPFIDTHSANT